MSANTHRKFAAKRSKHRRLHLSPKQKVRH
ncbi:MAG: hypothetical protein QOF46_3030, partial [Paraburkholderia sp.]|nr:hypothetical protein [Paraburkholderia sp.]